MQVKAELVDRISKEGNPYTAVEITITDNIKKLLFLKPAELELLKIKLEESSLKEFSY